MNWKINRWKNNATIQSKPVKICAFAHVIWMRMIYCGWSVGRKYNLQPSYDGRSPTR